MRRQGTSRRARRKDRDREVALIRDSGALEKCVLERWLKRTRVGFAHSKLRTHLELRGTMDFDIHSVALFQ